VSTTSADDGPVCAKRNSQTVPASSNALFVSPHKRRDGYWASIRGHVLDLADPNSGHELAPTPGDLFIVSIASELAWTARTILRADGLPDDVCISANWRTNADPPSLADIDLTVTVSRRARAASAALAAAFEDSLAARSLAEPVAHISWEGAGR
jgi:uncharacterized OsmC-like protein